jgi:SAM-dependent methyltransferase
MIAESLYRLSKRKSRQNLYTWLAEAAQREAVAEAANVLNVGAGGEVAAFLDELGIRARSLDVDPRRNPDIVGSVEAMEAIGDSTVDAIFCVEVLEHVGRPEAAAAEIRRVLRPGGCLIGSTPFLLGIHDGPNDFHRFTRHGLQRLFWDFEEVALCERNGYFAAAAVLVYRRFVLDAPLGGMALLRAPLLLLLAFSLELFDRWLPSREGTTGYFFVYRRPREGGTKASE